MRNSQLVHLEVDNFKIEIVFGNWIEGVEEGKWMRVKNDQEEHAMYSSREAWGTPRSDDT